MGRAFRSQFLIPRDARPLLGVVIFSREDSAWWAFCGLGVLDLGVGGTWDVCQGGKTPGRGGRSSNENVRAESLLREGDWGVSRQAVSASAAIVGHNG
jgi:hypothetical protein